MTLSLLSNSSDRFPVVLVSPRLRRSNASLERLLDGSWYAAAPTSSREALLMPQCRLRSARRGCVEGALHGLEDSPYPARMRKAPPTSQGAQSPGRRIAGGKGMCAARITRPLLGAAHPPSPDSPWASAGATAVPAPSRTGPT